MIEVNSDNFEQEVLKSDKPVLVDYWGPKCEPCKALMPHVEKLEEKYKDKVKFCKLDSSKNARLCISQRVMGLPTFIIYKDGEGVERISKEVTIDMVEDLVKKYA